MIDIADQRPFRRHALQEVQFEAQFEATAGRTRSLANQTGRIIVPVGRDRDEQVLPCEVLTFTMARHANKTSASGKRRQASANTG